MAQPRRWTRVGFLLAEYSKYRDWTDWWAHEPGYIGAGGRGRGTSRASSRPQVLVQLGGGAFTLKTGSQDDRGAADIARHHREQSRSAIPVGGQHGESGGNHILRWLD